MAKAKDQKPGKQQAPTQPARLQTLYRETAVPALMKQFGYKTVMQVPAAVLLVQGVAVLGRLFEQRGQQRTPNPGARASIVDLLAQDSAEGVLVGGHDEREGVREGAI